MSALKRATSVFSISTRSAVENSGPFSSFWASAYKEVLVFTLIFPVLWWRSRSSHHVEEDEE